MAHFRFCFIPVSIQRGFHPLLAVLINSQRKREVGDPLGGKVIEFSAAGCQMILKCSFVTSINYWDYTTKELSECLKTPIKINLSRPPCMKKGLKKRGLRRNLFSLVIECHIVL